MNAVQIVQRSSVHPSVPAAVETSSATEVVAWAAREFGDGLVLSTSFGIQSAVMLHLVSQVKPDIPVIWVDTGYLPSETYTFAASLTERLGLNLFTYQSPISPARMEAVHGRLWERDDLDALDTYNRIRKVEPMRRALDELGAKAWLSGLRADQTTHRKTLPIIGLQGARSKILPILDWSAKDVHRYLKEHALPYHPLFDQGYATVGDWHSSRPLTPADDHERESRFAGLKEECGLHLEDDGVSDTVGASFH